LAEHEVFDTDDGIATPEHDFPQPIARLETRHFHKIDNAVREFHDYMTNVCGEDFSGIAKMKSERDDDFEPPRRHSEQHLTPYSGGYEAQRGGPFGAPEQRSRQQRWGSFSRDQERPYFAG